MYRNEWAVKVIATNTVPFTTVVIVQNLQSESGLLK